MSEAPATGATTNVCVQCGAQFRCGMEAGDQACWCAGLPALLPLPEKSGTGSPAASCLCPACLKARLASASSAA